ncbi:MAG: hypothetical protein PUE67_01485 [Oscillospiraceae bacterium]|nr:hypothetical protein [Oscillospiraceae bacterium]
MNAEFIMHNAEFFDEFVIRNDRVGILGDRQPPPEGGGGPLAVEGGKNFPLLLFLSLEGSGVICSDSYFEI